MSGTKWAASELETLRAEYPNTDTAELAKSMGRTNSSVQNMAQSLGLKKSASRIAVVQAQRIQQLNALALNRFSPGHNTWNKGKKLPGHGAPNTFFKQGHVPHTHKPIGSQRLCKDGCLIVKVADTGVRRQDWVPAHVDAWVKAHGPIPKGHIVVFRQGMRTTKLHEITADRLECIDRAEVMRRNSVHNKYPPELVKLQQLRGVLTRQINKRAKEQRA